MTHQVHGLQAERTALAWMRTFTAAVVNTALLVRVGLNAPYPDLVAATGSMLALSVATAWWHQRRTRPLTRPGAPFPTMPPLRLMLLVTVLTTVSGVAVLLGLLRG